MDEFDKQINRISTCRDMLFTIKVAVDKVTPFLLECDREGIPEGAGQSVMGAVRIIDFIHDEILDAESELTSLYHYTSQQDKKQS